MPHRRDRRAAGAGAEHDHLLAKRLEAAGLVTRVRSTTDERQVRVRLTDVGRQRWADTGCLAQLILERTGMTHDRLARLNGEVIALRRALADPVAVA